MTLTFAFGIVLIAQLLSPAMGSCRFPRGEVVRCDPVPAERAARPYVAEYLAASAPPVLYVVTDCNVTEPIDVKPLHPQYREWLANRRYDDHSAAAPVLLPWRPDDGTIDVNHSGVVRCNRTRVTNAAQLEAVSSRITGDGRQSYRARPAVVDVVWDGLEDAVKTARAAIHCLP